MRMLVTGGMLMMLVEVEWLAGGVMVKLGDLTPHRGCWTGGSRKLAEDQVSS